jgi:PAS domain S-box-containing protein
MFTQEFFKQVIEKLNHAVIISDSNGNFTLWNEYAKKILGMNEKIMDVDKWQDHFRIYKADGVQYSPDELPIMKAVKTGEPSRKERLFITSGKEPGGWLEVDAFPIKDDGGKIQGAVAEFTDITQTLKTEKFIDDIIKNIEHIKELVKHSFFTPSPVMNLPEMA